MVTVNQNGIPDIYVLYGVRFLHLLVSAVTLALIVTAISGIYSNSPEPLTIPPVMELGSDWSVL